MNRTLRCRVLARCLLALSLSASFPCFSGAQEAEAPAGPEELEGETEVSVSLGLDAESEDEVGGTDALEASSGIRVSTICTNCNAATLTVNGLSGEHVGLSFDGTPVAGGLAAVYYLSQFPEEFIAHQGTSRGPGIAGSGAAATAGGIELHSVRRDERRLFVRSELGSEGWRKLLAGATERWSRVGALLLVQAARSDAWDSNNDEFNDVPEFERFSYQGILDIHLNDQQVLKLGGSFYGEDQVDGPGHPVDYRDIYLHEDAFFNWREFTLAWERESATGVGLSARARYSRRAQQQWSPLDIGFEPQRTFFIEDERLGAEFKAEGPVGVAGWLSGGVEWEELRLGVEQDFFSLGEPFYIEDGLRHLGAFLQWDGSSGQRWAWSLGLRHDRFTVFGFHLEEVDRTDVVGVRAPNRESSYFLPRAQVSFRPSDTLTLSVAGGRGAVGPRPAFEQTCCGARYQRSLELAPERSWSSQAKIEWRPRPSQRLAVFGFWTDFKDYLERTIYQSNAAIPYYKQENVPRARVQGVEVAHDMRFAKDRLTLGWSYTYTDSEVREGLVIPDEGAAEERQCRGLDQLDYPIVLDEEGSRLRYIPRHAASTSLTWDDGVKGNKLELTGAWQGSVRHFRIGKDDGSGWERQACEPWSFLDSESFWKVDARYERRFRESGWSAHVGVGNVFDYVMPDLGSFESAWDWGPVQGRFFYAGATWSL